MILRGDLRIGAADDATRETGAALCRCGLSEYKPFCDGSHQDHFEDAGQLGKIDLAPATDAEAPQTLSLC